MEEHSSHRHTDHVSLNVLPDDIIEQALRYVPPLDNLAALQTLSRRLHRLANQPLLWRYHCLATFQYWRPEHALETLLQRNAPATNWKALFLKRQRQNASMDPIFDRIVTTQVDRFAHMWQICEHGYDAKDFLIRKYRTPNDDPNVLAERYYAETILGSIHRSIAIKQWFQVHNSDPTYPLNIQSSLEKSLAAFDLFVLHDQRGDLDEIGRLLDTYTNAFMRTQPQWRETSTRQRALQLNHWIRTVNLVGLDDQRLDYRNLRNCFIGQALRGAKHESIPIISCAIYCCIAARVGLRAECFLAPICVHVVVTAPPGVDLDGSPSTDEHQMYLDPFATFGEVPLDRLEHLAAQADMTVSSLRGSGTVAAVATRTAHNIEAAHGEGSRRSDVFLSSELLRGNAAVNRHLALYAARWALLLLEPPEPDHNDHNVAFRLDRDLQLLAYVRHEWPEDEWIMAWYLRAAQSRRADHGADVGRSVARHRAINSWGSALTAQGVSPFRIGQIFIHRRYQWLGAIVGFYEVPSSSSGVLHGASGSANSHWRRFYIRTINAFNLEEQVLAPENLQVTDDASKVEEGMFPLAGKYFKRFDRNMCCFISNVDECYPGLAAANTFA